MRWAACTLILTATLFGGGSSAPGESDPKPQRPETFLGDWVRGSARFELYTSIHEWASDTHRSDTESFEVAIKALALRESDLGKTRSALARALVHTFRSPDSDSRTCVRALHVLGRLAAPEGLELLIEQSSSKQFERRVAAILALGFFGHAPAEESFIVYGGRLWFVVLPPAANAAATRALVKALDVARAERRAGKSADARAAFRQRMSTLSSALGEALRAHRSPVLTAKLLATAAAPGALHLDHDILVETLARCAYRDGVGPLVRAVLEEAAAVRSLAAQALGLSARKEAVEPLIALLGDADPTVVDAARTALMKLAGEKTAPSESGRSYWNKRLGSEGQRFDASCAERPEDLRPGVYKLGA